MSNTIRDDILSYLESKKFKSFKVAKELPFDPNKTVLYVKNPMTIYVDAEQVATEPFMQLFDETIDQEITSIAIFLATDAKQLPPDYTTVVSQIRAAKDIQVGTYFVRQSDLSTEIDKDLLITTVTIVLSKIISK